MPWASIAVLAATLAGAGAAKLLGDVLGGDVLQQLALVAAAEDVDLLDGDGVQPALDNAPHGREAPGSVDEEQLAQTLGVVVLGDDRGLADVRVHLGNLGQGDALEVHDGAARLEEVAGLAGAGGQTGVSHTLVFDGKIGEHAVGGRDLVHGIQVNAAEGLDVNGAAILVKPD